MDRTSRSPKRRAPENGSGSRRFFVDNLNGGGSGTSFGSRMRRWFRGWMCSRTSTGGSRTIKDDSGANRLKRAAIGNFIDNMRRKFLVLEMLNKKK